MRRTIDPYLRFMRIELILILGIIIMAATANVQTVHVWQDDWWGSHRSTDPNIPKYNAQELGGLPMIRYLTLLLPSEAAKVRIVPVFTYYAIYPISVSEAGQYQ